MIVSIERLLPGGAAVHAPKYAALGVLPEGMPQRSQKHHFGIMRIDNDATDSARVAKSHILPGATGIDGFIDAVSAGNIATQRLSGSGVQDIRIARSHRQ